jgi:hypothetical protein
MNQDSGTKNDRSWPALAIPLIISGIYVGAQLVCRLLLGTCGYNPITFIKRYDNPRTRTTTVEVANQYLLPSVLKFRYRAGRLVSAETYGVLAQDSDRDGRLDEIWNDGKNTAIGAKDLVATARADRQKGRKGRLQKMLNEGVGVWEQGERVGRRLGVIKRD